MTYEELVSRPKLPLEKIFKAWDQAVDLDQAMSRLKTPSSVVYKSGISGIDGWKKKLSKDQISKILNVTENFGLCFYGQQAEPDYGVLYSDQLPGYIRKVGTG